jgi:putative transposase
LGRSRGGLTTKIHLATDECGRAVRIIIGPGQESDYRKAAELIAGIKAEALIADKGYDADRIIEQAKAQGIKQVVIPPKSSRKDQRVYNKEWYRERNRIERFFNRLKHYRKISSRFEKTARNFLSLIYLATTIINQQISVNTA